MGVMRAGGALAALAAAVAIGASGASGAGTDFALTCGIGEPDCQSCDAELTPGCNCTRQDYNLWTNQVFFEYEAALQSCAFDSIFDGVDISSAHVCLQNDKATNQLSDSCNWCFAAIIDCTINVCPRACATLSGRENPDCRRCVEEMCEPSFVQCSGWTTRTCNVCVEPEVPIIPGLENLYFYIIVAAAGLLLLGGVAFVSWKTCQSTEEDRLVAIEVNEGNDHQITMASLTGKSSKFSPNTPASRPSTAFTEASTPPPPGLGGSGFRQGSFDSMQSYDLDDFAEKPDI